MRKWHVIGGAAVLVAALAAGGLWRGPASAQERPARAAPAWEYKVEAVPALALDQQGKKLNDLGSDGWELCASERNGEREGVTFLVFKRPRR